MRIFKEEIFGPVLSVTDGQSLDEALQFANGGIWPHDVHLHRECRYDYEFRRRGRDGMVHVNEPTIGGEAQLPFGGMESHRRRRARNGRGRLNFFTELKPFSQLLRKAERLMIRERSSTFKA